MSSSLVLVLKLFARYGRVAFICYFRLHTEAQTAWPTIVPQKRGAPWSHLSVASVPSAARVSRVWILGWQDVTNGVGGGGAGTPAHLSWAGQAQGYIVRGSPFSDRLWAVSRGISHVRFIQY